MKTDGMINAPTTVENATPAPAPDPRSITVKLKPKRSTIKLTAGDRKLEISPTAKLKPIKPTPTVIPDLIDLKNPKPKIKPITNKTIGTNTVDPKDKI